MATATEESASSGPKTNKIGKTRTDYKGLPSTLCKGCGHDSITSQIIAALWENNIEPWQVAKMSGIGCSSKTTAYFLSESHGFNSVHGRMAPITTGAHLANTDVIKIGVSGDGDTASIGLGNFLHMVRRNVPMIYLIENNGVYGLTKGQFSATADRGSLSKGGMVNNSEPVDICALAITMGCGFVARSFSGDFKQLSVLLQAAMNFNGSAIIDIVSPCITFNNHEGSTKSQAYAKANEIPIHEVGFVPFQEPITADYSEGETTQIELPDGGTVILKKLDRDYDPTNKYAALQLLAESAAHKQFLTGLIYIDNDLPTIDDQLQLVDTPLAKIPSEVLRPSREALAELMDSLR